MLNVDYPQLLDLFPEHGLPGRTDSAAFLIWYLQNYYRLDEVEAVDSVCDQRGDKGVDGIYVNDQANLIEVFQARISQRSDATTGDAGLREFHGTLAQFRSREAVENLVGSAGDAHVAKLILRLDLPAKIESYEHRGIYLTNIDIDANGEAYLRHQPEISFVGKTTLISTYVSDSRSLPAISEAEFDVSGFQVGEYIVDSTTSAVIAPVSARELIKLDGIADQSLYAFNVRASLGKTQVNRDIVKSISDPQTHKLFPLFHNGITIICQQLERDENRIRIGNYYVVNGCQSLTALYENQKKLSDDLRLLTKFVKVGNVESDLAVNITQFSNNQNGVKARDFKANDPIQIRLQNEFASLYRGAYWFDIKRGEATFGGEEISNEDAGLYLMAFDLKEPWATHRKYQVFGDKHADLFARPEVTADRIVMLHEMVKVIGNVSESINNKLFGKYVLTRYALLFMLNQILDHDDRGRDLLRSPGDFVRHPDRRAHLREALRQVLNDMIIDINAEVQEFGDDFDYRGRLRDPDWVKQLASSVVGTYLKLVARRRVPAFADEWQRLEST